MRTILQQSGLVFILLSILFIQFLPGFLISQDNAAQPKFGLSAAFQGAQLDILLPVWMSETIILAPALKFSSVSQSSKDIGIGLVPRFFLKRAKLSPFVSIRAALLFYYPRNDEVINDLLLGIGAGGEYFFDSNFSIGIEAQINYARSHERSTRFNNPNGTNTNTATVIFGSIYF
jgi:hypothetical protein